MRRVRGFGGVGRPGGGGVVAGFSELFARIRDTLETIMSCKEWHSSCTHGNNMLALRQVLGSSLVEAEKSPWAEQ